MQKLNVAVDLYIRLSTNSKINRIYDGVEVETRESQASFQIIKSCARLAEHKT